MDEVLKEKERLVAEILSSFNIASDSNRIKLEGIVIGFALASERTNVNY